MKLLLYAFLASSAAAAEFGGRRPALRALQQDEQLIDVQQDIEFSMSMASAGSAMEGEAKSAKSAKLFKSGKTSGDEEICVPPSNSKGPVYPDAEQQQMLLHQATDGGEDLSGEDFSYLSEDEYNDMYGKKEMMDKTLTNSGRLPSKDFPSNFAVIFGDDLDFINPELLGKIGTANQSEQFGERVNARFIPSKIDGINSVLEAKSLCATICEKLSNCVGFEFVDFYIDSYNCFFYKEGIAVISDYPLRRLTQRSLLLKDPIPFISSSDPKSNFCEVPQGEVALNEAAECYSNYMFHWAKGESLKLSDRCKAVGAKATFLLPVVGENIFGSLEKSGACIIEYLTSVYIDLEWGAGGAEFSIEDCLPLIEEDFVKHIIPALACLSRQYLPKEVAPGVFVPDAEAVQRCIDCVSENAAACATVCDEEDDGTVTFLKPCLCAGDDEQCKCKCKTCGDVCPQTACTAQIQSAMLCSSGTGVFQTGALDENLGCINSNIKDTTGNLIEILEHDFECAFKEDM